MDPTLILILEKTRELTFKYGVKGVTLDKVCNELDITRSQLNTYIKDDRDLVEKVLDRDGQSVVGSGLFPL